MEAAGAERRRRRKEARPGEILDAAFEEFSAAGFAATRLDDVANRAGITKGTIYVYFPNKEELFLATIKERMRPTLEHMEALTASPRGSAMDILREHFGFVYGRMVEDPQGREMLRMLIAEGGRFPALTERWHAEVINPSVEALRRVVRYGIDRGEFHATAAEEFPHLIFSPVMMACTWKTLFGDAHPLDIARYREAHLTMLALSLERRPGDAAPGG
ncbi:TetR/AcrR family transcriptional regulator [uncultured Methylobacterium sp.]|jgi:AcrR family transcriptional regulator|uniref:TetR/AcrR family transcriptional regulator n=1 Tax=uncultured Methylobacterium sp. TaxID=157278 RepID=UPI00261BD5A4|nr:TetR/AcrR family transcriptional regulator [uncultured Methylobacterium sp.]